MRKHSKNSPIVVKRVPGVFFTDKDIKDIQEAARRLLDKYAVASSRPLGRG
jgi:hypothetical protein